MGKLHQQWWDHGRALLFSSLILAFVNACTPGTEVAVPTATIKTGKLGSSNVERTVPEQLDESDASELGSDKAPVSNDPNGSPSTTEPDPKETMSPGEVVVPKPDPVLPKTDPKPTEPAESLVVPNGKYVIRSVHSQRCLDIPGASTNTGVGLEIYDCAQPPSPGQLFELKHVGSKMYQITLIASGKSLEVRGQVLEATKLIQQAPYVDGKYQQFEFLPQDDGTYIIRCNGANLVFDVTAAKTENKTPIQLWNPNNFVNEKWTLTPQ